MEGNCPDLHPLHILVSMNETLSLTELAVFTERKNSSLSKQWISHEVAKFRTDFMRFSKISPRVRLCSESSVRSSEALHRLVYQAEAGERSGWYCRRNYPIILKGETQLNKAPILRDDGRRISQSGVLFEKIDLRGEYRAR
jgi:hypothetical protein